jgi:hypothetical protein
VDIPNIGRNIGRAKDITQFALDTQILKDSNLFIPADTWNLRDSSLRHSKIGEGQLMWVTPYANKVYYNPQMNFSTDKNPMASGLWYERAKAMYLNSWITLAQTKMDENI